MTTFRVLLLVMGLLVALTVPAGAIDLGGALEAALAERSDFMSRNITFHDNDRHRVGGVEGQELTGGGSDIEFATVEVDGAPMRLALAGTIDLGGPNGGLQIYDLADETDPQLIAVWDCRVSQGDIQVFTREVDEALRTYVAYGADYSVNKDSTCVTDAAAMGLEMGNSQGAYFADITDPYNPVTVGYVNISTGSHNTTVHPSGNYLYNSANGIGASIGQLDYVDISDLANPVKLGRLNLETGIENHDITFSADGTRAYVAAINQSLILDTTDPAAPTILSRIVNASATIHHQADPVTLTHPVLGERTYLVITDEFGGAAGNAVCPGGGLIIYDITGDLEATPVMVGAWFAPQAEVSQGEGRGSLGILPACTSHVLRFHPDAGIMTIGWYSAGVRVVDISNLIGASVGVVPGLGDTGSLGDHPALDGLDLTVATGEVHGLPRARTGRARPPRCGSCSACCAPTRGRVRSCSAVTRGATRTDLHRRLAYVPGDVTLWPKLSGGEVIDLLGRLRGGWIDPRRDDLIERFDLDPTKKGAPTPRATGRRSRWLPRWPPTWSCCSSTSRPPGWTR
jgi:hypothetical protein